MSSRYARELELLRVIQAGYARQLTALDAPVLDALVHLEPGRLIAALERLEQLEEAAFQAVLWSEETRKRGYRPADLPPGLGAQIAGLRIALRGRELD